MPSRIRYITSTCTLLLSLAAQDTCWATDKLYATTVLSEGQVDVMAFSTDSHATRDVLHTPSLTAYSDSFHTMSHAASIRYGLGGDWQAGLAYQYVPWSRMESNIGGSLFRTDASGSTGTTVSIKRGFGSDKPSAWSSSAYFGITAVPHNDYTHQSFTLFQGQLSLGYDCGNQIKPYARLSLEGSNRGSLRKIQGLTLGTEIEVLPQIFLEPGLRLSHLTGTNNSTSMNERRWFLDARAAITTDTYVLAEYARTESTDWQSGVFRISNGASHSVQLGLYHLFR